MHGFCSALSCAFSSASYFSPAFSAILFSSLLRFQPFLSCVLDALTPSPLDACLHDAVGAHGVEITGKARKDRSQAHKGVETSYLWSAWLVSPRCFECIV